MRLQPTTKIGDFTYILEDHIGDQYCWRCKYVQCKGKCRTNRDGRLVLGPSQHTCLQLADSVKVSGGLQGGQIDNEATTQSIPESFMRQQHEEERDEPEEKKPNLLQLAEQKKLEGNKIIVSTIVKSEPRSPPEVFVKRERSLNSSPERAASDAMASTYDWDRDHKRRGPLQPLKTAREEYLHMVSESEDEDATEDERSGANASGREVQVDAEQTFPNASADAKDKATRSHRPETTDCEGSSDDYDEEDDEEHRITNRSVCEETNMSQSPHARCAQVLQMTDESCEREMRISLFRQMCELLNAETELAKQRRRNAVIRGRLLARRLADL
ncbi:hypothetical protein HPB52_015839 [Rhipicephalus sanguineus]|uniref:Uncharacterized protein n=1 Tax=Rhipicephalus sanguineus TaxID=34632 RepID=A0A9D4PPA0_RHISA|nr:hypothetical protein HPB52_015839 [Rhipicephalus sanguineus]